MIIKTKEFRDVADKILLASTLDTSATNLDLHTSNGYLYLSVTNKEYFVSIKFPIETDEQFRAVVDASLFLPIVSKITTETFALDVDGNSLLLTIGKSKYKLAMIFENDSLLQVKPIVVNNKTVEMPIAKSILSSILNINSREILKTKSLDVNELQSLYYIDETGCFTFTTGACLNTFTLEKPIKMLLNDRIVKLFKLFSTDVSFTLGKDLNEDGTILTKAVFESENIYLAAIITCDDILISKIQGPYAATKRYLQENYDQKLVVSADELSNAIARLILFTKNNKSNIERVNMSFLLVDISVNNNELIIKDKFGNEETVNIENGSYSNGTYDFSINLVDLKFIAEAHKNEHITINCGNHKSVVIVSGNISNLLPECRNQN